MPVRVLLVELIGTHPHLQTRAALFPQLQGDAKAAGAECRWVVRSLDTPFLSDLGETVSLPEDVTAELAVQVRAFEPTHVVTSHPVDERSSVVLREAGLGIALECLSGPRGELDASEFLVRLGPPDPGTRPDFEAHAVDDSSRKHLPIVPLRLGTMLPFSLRRRFSPFDGDGDGRDAAVVPAPDGCSKFDPDDLSRQLVAAQQSRDGGAEGLVFHALGECFVRHLDEAAEVVARDLSKPALFHSSVRAETLVACGDVVERGVARLVELGHRVLLGLVAADCPQEGLRARIQGLAAPDNADAARTLLASFEERWSGQVIVRQLVDMADTPLFTPWSDLGGLRASVEHFSALELGRASHYLASRLRVDASDALARSLDRDGLRASDFDSGHFPRFDSASSGPGIPWRFADPKVGAVHGAIVRLLAQEEGRLLSQEERSGRAERLRTELGPVYGQDPARLLLHLLDIMEAGSGEEGRVATVDSLFDVLEQEAEILRKGAEEPPPEPAPENPPPEPDAEMRGAAEAIQSAFNALDEPARVSFDGFVIRDLLPGFTAEENPVVDLVLGRGKDEIRLNLLPRSAVRGSYSNTERFAICYERDGAADSPEREQVLHAVTELVRRATDGDA